MSMKNSNYLKSTLSYITKYYRQKLELTQKAMADHCGLSFRLYQKIESGNVNPTISTLDKIASSLQITLCRLLNLQFIKIKTTPEKYLDIFKETFEHQEIAVGIRDLEGVIIYGNMAAASLQKRDFSSRCDLLKHLTPEAAEVLKAQLQSEKNFMVQPYINSNYLDGKLTYFRFHPCLVLPQKGKTPVFVVTYITLAEKESEKNYYTFCNLLINTVC